MIEIISFFLWTLILYGVHRLFHVVPILKKIHFDHHLYQIKNKEKIKWKWNNLLLYNDTKLSTIDLWLTEVIPTLIFAYLSGQWWIFYFYYFWAAFIQESIEHNPKINLYPFTSGQWHLVHHKNFKKNYGLFHPLWDRLFRTEML
jgi:sterol desaturase/sphingolipid hydroxylase (fatty acid hydroxylase superfamily)